MTQQSKRPNRSIRVRSQVGAMGSHGGRARSALLFCAALAAPAGLRAMLLVEHSMTPVVGDLRGLLSDVGVALGVATAVGLLARLQRWAGLVLLLLWVLLCYGNYEHVSANGANMALRYAGYLTDITFLVGSALAVTQPWLLAGALVAALALGWVALRAAARVRLGMLAIGCAVAAAVFFLWTASSETLLWRQINFVMQNASQSTETPAASDSIAPPTPGRPAPNFEGEPLVALGNAKTNVLLVLLEGVSGAYIEPMLAANDRRVFRISMPELGQIARDHVFFTSFIAQQRQTNRGEYAVLCGELPRLHSVEAKMTELATRTLANWNKRCLPAALAEAGYATVYLQAAPMSFMLKDQFMPNIGFERSLGDAYFEDAYSRNKWGVDDRTFLQQSLRMIDELRSGERPWFLTLLTVGTHHPINVPEDFPRIAGTNARWRAFDHLDFAVGEFMTALEKRGVLEDTLVLLLSDESQGLRGEGMNTMQTQLSQSWGFLIAILPGGEKLRVDTPYAQVDIAGSILDWLGLAEYAHGFSGRSVFRRYATPRPLAFGNTYLTRVGGVSADGELLLCAEDLHRCIHAGTNDQRLFKRDLQPLSRASAADLAFLREQMDESKRISESTEVEGGVVKSDSARDFRLSEVSVFPIRDDVDDRQWVFGGQYMTIPANSRIDVELEVELLGEDGRVEMQHALKTEVTNYFAQQVLDMQPGGRLNFRYSYWTDEPLFGVGNYLVVTRVAGTGLSLKLRRARMRFLPATDTPDPPLVVHELDIQRGPVAGDPGGAAQR